MSHMSHMPRMPRMPHVAHMAHMAHMAHFLADHAWICKSEQGAVAVVSSPAMGLSGLRFAVKDNIDAAGLPTTAACSAFAHTPAQSAQVV